IALYRQVEVPMSENEQFMKPTRSIIIDTLYTQYVELQQKQITKWNQRRKKKIEMSASLKQRDKSKGACGNIQEKINGMIRWMSET
ncbi:hypothetical protein J1N35_014076, partial [Gossypium stocksii]